MQELKGQFALNWLIISEKNNCWYLKRKKKTQLELPGLACFILKQSIHHTEGANTAQSDGGQQQMEENLHGKGAYLWKQQV